MLACALLLRSESVVADELQRLVHRLALRQLRNIRTCHHRRRQVRLVQQIAAADLHRIQAQVTCDDIQNSLAHPRLNRPRTAVRHVARLVAEDHPQAEAEALEPVTRPGSIVRAIRPNVLVVLGGVGYAPWSMIMSRRKPSSVPSFLMAASTVTSSSRAWPDAIKFSRRSSTHLTGSSEDFAGGQNAQVFTIDLGLTAEGATNILRIYDPQLMHRYSCRY